MNEGIKYDSGKAKIGEMLVSFKRSLLEVCKVYEFGFNKYGKDNFKNVENGYTRYTNAMIRHLLKEDSEVYDEETELLHASHCAWNALARLEMLLKQREQEAAEAIEEQEINNAKAEQMPQVAENKLEKIKDLLETCNSNSPEACLSCEYLEDCPGAGNIDRIILQIIEGNDD